MYRHRRGTLLGDGAIAVWVVREGLSEEVTLEHLDVSRQLEEWQEG